MKEIKITCKGAISVSIDSLLDFQGNLKTMTKESYARLRASILKFGFSFAEHVWKDPEGKYYILDGHHRIKVIRKMISDEKYNIGKIPCVLVDAKDRREAKAKLLAAASQYAHVDDSGFGDFIMDAEIEMDEIGEFADIPEIMHHFEPEIINEKEIDENIETKSKCPKCGYEW